MGDELLTVDEVLMQLCSQVLLTVKEGKETDKTGLDSVIRVMDCIIAARTKLDRLYGKGPYE